MVVQFEIASATAGPVKRVPKSSAFGVPFPGAEVWTVAVAGDFAQRQEMTKLVVVVRIYIASATGGAGEWAHDIDGVWCNAHVGRDRSGARIAGGMPFLGVRLRRQAFVEGFTAQVDDSLNEIVLLPRRPLEELKAFRGPYGEDLVEDRGNFNVG